MIIYGHVFNPIVTLAGGGPGGHLLRVDLTNLGRETLPIFVPEIRKSRGRDGQENRSCSITSSREAMIICLLVVYDV